MGFFPQKKHKIKVQTSKRDSFSGWLKCTSCKELIHSQELSDNKNCCPKCEYHYRLPAFARIKMLADEGSFNEMFSEIHSINPLKFVDTETYPSRLKKATEKSGLCEAIVVGSCKINKIPIALGVMDFNFMGGSMGSVVGEKLTLIMEYALEHSLPLVIVACSGGARMQESIYSLMQMAKTSAALAKLSEACIPYISVFTNPTTGGVTASFASLGDVIIAEPEALIGFAGPRVIEQTTGQPLPAGAQMSEFLLKRGMIDCIVKRHDLKEKLAKIINYFIENEDKNGL